MATDDHATVAEILLEAEHSYQHEENAEAWSNEDVGVPLDALALLAEALNHMVDTD
jgi:hypothetical protein